MMGMCNYVTRKLCLNCGVSNRYVLCKKCDNCGFTFLTEASKAEEEAFEKRFIGKKEGSL